MMILFHFLSSALISHDVSRYWVEIIVLFLPLSSIIYLDVGLR